MKISLLHNAAAGDGISVEGLRLELQKAGYEIALALDRDADLERFVREPADLHVVAGGDGTVRKAALAAAGRGISIAVLPLGTANNIARALGVEGPVHRVIRSWSSGRRRAFDLGVVRGEWGESRFLEGVGGGLVASVIAAREATASKEGDEDADAALARARQLYGETLSRAVPRRGTLTVDGNRIEGEFLLLEVLNIRSLGPNLTLSAVADPSDGLLDVVMAEEKHREELADYLLRRLDGRESWLSLPTRRGRRVEVQGFEQMHVDGDVRSRSASEPVAVTIEAGAVEFLV